MIIVQLNGGLGNQLFQYALGRRLAVQFDVPLKLDLSIFKTYPLRTYRLQHFNITGNIATNKEIYSLRDNPNSGLISKIHHILNQKQHERNRVTHIREQAFSFDPEVLNAPPDVYLEGYWQSEKYFKEIEQIIRAEFTVKEEMNLANRELAAIITETNSISLHIRRGDYVSDPNTNQYHGTCTLDYYHRAVEIMKSTVDEPHFFIFSDDPDWVRENLHLKCNMTPVTINGSEYDYNDLRLMSLCKHHILANSSFSWWGAWLNNFKEKSVIAPQKWFNASDLYTRDLLPDSWLKI